MCDEMPSSAPWIGMLVPPGPPRHAASATALPAVRADAGLLGGRWIAAASLVGQSHSIRGNSAQDSYCFAASEDGEALVLVICDGLGQHAHTAQIGAELFTRLCVAEIAAIPSAEVRDRGFEPLTEAANIAVGKLLRCKDILLGGIGAKQLSCTALICWLPLSHTDETEALFLRAGDCEAIWFSAAGGFEAVYPDADNGPLNLVRHTLPSPQVRDVLESARSGVNRDGLLILATDGLATDIFDSPHVRDWLVTQWARPCGAHRMLDSMRYRRQGSQDDRTAVVVWMDPPAYP
ncbi:hypothetical protein D6158_26300 [Nocardia seriolae]|nr:hypothetical protein D6158_26300 [Nocardia seriolae]